MRMPDSTGIIQRDDVVCMSYSIRMDANYRPQGMLGHTCYMSLFNVRPCLRTLGEDMETGH